MIKKVSDFSDDTILAVSIAGSIAAATSDMDNPKK